MNYKDIYLKWKNDEFFDAGFRAELSALSDEKEIEDRFYKELEFGTGGLRGVMGAGSNRMNRYTVRKAAAGFGLYLLDRYGDAAKERGIAVAYDTRNNSKDFALETALAIADLGIKAYLFEMISATPLLSFAVRYLNCVGGVVITASHNPKEYNGFKAYDETGCQLCVDDAEAAIEKINGLEIDRVAVADEAAALAEGKLVYIGEDVLAEYSKAVIAASPSYDREKLGKLKVAYSPIHGSGNVSVRRVLKDAGFNIDVLAAQEKADGNFPTVKSPNPGNEPTMAMALEFGNEIGADIVVASDPDADRAGVLIRHGGKLEFLDGNSIGALLLYYVIERDEGKTKGPHFISTIVSGELTGDICRKYGVAVDRYLTGFKFIGEAMTKMQSDPDNNFLFGCEESFGFLGGDYVRDKCAAYAILNLCTACAYYLDRGKTLGDVMDSIHEEFGFYLDSLDSYVFKGKEGAEKMKALTAGLREKGASLLPGVSDIKDYAPGCDGLPPSDVLKYFFEDGSWMAVRPSGTEPQIKVYYSTKGASKSDAEKSYAERKSVMDKYFE